MLLSKHLSSYIIYITILIISSSFLIGAPPEFPIINITIYLFIHILLIYIGIYHFTVNLYFIFILAGLIFDIFLISEIGTHTITFMILIILLKQLKKFIISFSSNKIFIFIILTLIISVIFEMLISLVLFNINIEIFNLLKSFLIILLISYPIFYLFNKIDRLG